VTSGRLAVAAVLSMAASTGTAEPFRLSDAQLDQVTAGGITIVADAFAVATGFGDPAIGDSTSDSSVMPERGSAFASGIATGPDGADVLFTVVIEGEDGMRILTTTAEAVGGTRDGGTVMGSADGALVVATDAAEAGGASVLVGGDGATGALTELRTVAGEDGIAGLAVADGVTAGAGGLSQTELRMVIEALNFKLDAAAAAAGDAGSSAYAGVAAAVERGGAAIEMEAWGDAASGDDLAGARQVLLVGQDGVVARIVGSASAADLAGSVSAATVTVGGIPADAVRTAIRSTHRGGLSRSTATAVVPTD
jgi:hypothetical protein